MTSFCRSTGNKTRPAPSARSEGSGRRARRTSGAHRRLCGTVRCRPLRGAFPALAACSWDTASTLRRTWLRASGIPRPHRDLPAEGTLPAHPNGARSRSASPPSGAASTTDRFPAPRYSPQGRPRLRDRRSALEAAHLRRPEYRLPAIDSLGVPSGAPEPLTVRPGSGFGFEGGGRGHRTGLGLHRRSEPDQTATDQVRSGRSSG